MLVMLDPNTLPTAISICPFNAAVVDTISSGSDVPMPTIVMPMINGGTPSEREITAAP